MLLRDGWERGCNEGPKGMDRVFGGEVQPGGIAKRVLTKQRAWAAGGGSIIGNVRFPNRSLKEPSIPFHCMCSAAIHSLELRFEFLQKTVHYFHLFHFSLK